MACHRTSLHTQTTPLNATTTRLEKAKSLLKSALAGIEAEIKQPGELYRYLVACGGTPAESPADQTLKNLRNARKELTRMLNEVEAGKIDPWHRQHTWLGQALVDSWPWKHPLTELVLKAESAYLKISTRDR
jgi:hypothetical protein